MSLIHPFFRKLLLSTLCLLLTQAAFSQKNPGRTTDILDARVSRQRFGNSTNNSASKSSSNSKSFAPHSRLIAISDTTMMVTASVLMNLDPDGFKITLGLNQQASNINVCTELINQKIAQFKTDIKALGITEKDVYVDIITQFPIYGYDIEKKAATEQLEGYEIDKNIIIRFDSISKLSQLITTAAQNNIHNVAKLDYLLYDIEAVYEKLFSEAQAIIEKKKKRYLDLSHLKIADQAMVFSEQFQFVFPYELYESYTAFESSDLEYNTYRSKRVIEKRHKKTTSYYDAIDFSKFDKYINPDKISVGLQAVFQIQVRYERLQEN